MNKIGKFFLYLSFVLFALTLFQGFWLKVVWPLLNWDLYRVFPKISSETWYNVIEVCLLISIAGYLRNVNLGLKE